MLESRIEKLSFFEHLGRTWWNDHQAGVRVDRATTLTRVFEAERSRAADAASAGVEGLLRHVADDAVAFTPAPGRAKAAWPANVAASPAAAGTKRDPRTGDVSGSRDLAWMLGRVESNSEGGVAPRGCFLSIWRQDDSRWRLVLDFEVAVEGDCVFDRSGFTPADDSVTSPAWNPAGIESLRQGEARVARLTAEKGVMAGLGDLVREDAHLYRTGLPPISGRARAREFLAADSVRTEFTPFGVVVSHDGSLGYTYGRVERTKEGAGETGYYVRVWRAWPGGDYAVVVDAQSTGR